MDNPFVSINEKLDLILATYNNSQVQIIEEKEEMWGVKEAAEFLKKSPQTIRRNIRSLPHYNKLGSVYFFKSELIAYVKQGK